MKLISIRSARELFPVYRFSIRPSAGRPQWTRIDVTTNKINVIRFPYLQNCEMKSENVLFVWGEKSHHDEAMWLSTL